jgi:hypothetical protein
MKWISTLDTPYYIYPVHVSLSFMFTPTLAQALYLLLLRFLHRDYNEVRVAFLARSLLHVRPSCVCLCILHFSTFD